MHDDGRRERRTALALAVEVLEEGEEALGGLGVLRSAVEDQRAAILRRRLHHVLEHRLLREVRGRLAEEVEAGEDSHAAAGLRDIVNKLEPLVELALVGAADVIGVETDGAVHKARILLRHRHDLLLFVNIGGPHEDGGALLLRTVQHIVNVGVELAREEGGGGVEIRVALCELVEGGRDLGLRRRLEGLLGAGSAGGGGAGVLFALAEGATLRFATTSTINRHV